MPKFEGIEFDFGGGVVYTIPPLAMGDLMKMSPQVKALQGTPEADALTCATVCIDVVHLALIRNYPKLSRDDVGALINLSNAVPAIQCAMDINGSYRKALKAADKGPGGLAG